MCLLAISRQQGAMSRNEFMLAAKTHGDGFGVTFKEGKLLTVIKTMKPELAYREYAAIDGVALLHFRFATVGAPKPRNCHPFSPDKIRLTEIKAGLFRGRTTRAVGHNGTFSEWERVAKAMGVNVEVDSEVIAHAYYSMPRWAFDELFKYQRVAVWDARKAEPEAIGAWTVSTGPLLLSNIGHRPYVRQPYVRIYNNNTRRPSKHREEPIGFDEDAYSPWLTTEYAQVSALFDELERETGKRAAKKG